VDEYLVVESQLGNARAFARLVRRWHPRLVRHAHDLTQDVDAAKDVTQDSWMAVVRGLGSLRDPARFKAWILRIVANKSRDWIRREQARRHAMQRAEISDTTSADTSRAEAIQRVRASLGALEPGQRQILAWFYLDGMSLSEIAAALSIPEGTVKSRLFYARQALRACVTET
jgi:RNA polymerase sigma-70 factor (ECF subfamily)